MLEQIVAHFICYLTLSLNIAVFFALCSSANDTPWNGQIRPQTSPNFSKDHPFVFLSLLCILFLLLLVLLCRFLWRLLFAFVSIVPSILCKHTFYTPTPVPFSTPHYKKLPKVQRTPPRSAFVRPSTYPTSTPTLAPKKVHFQYDSTKYLSFTPPPPPPVQQKKETTNDLQSKFVPIEIEDIEATSIGFRLSPSSSYRPTPLPVLSLPLLDENVPVSQLLLPISSTTTTSTSVSKSITRIKKPIPCQSKRFQSTQSSHLISTLLSNLIYSPTSPPQSSSTTNHIHVVTGPSTTTSSYMTTRHLARQHKKRKHKEYRTLPRKLRCLPPIIEPLLPLLHHSPVFSLPAFPILESPEPLTSFTPSEFAAYSFVPGAIKPKPLSPRTSSHTPRSSPTLSSISQSDSSAFTPLSTSSSLSPPLLPSPPPPVVESVRQLAPSPLSTEFAPPQPTVHTSPARTEEVDIDALLNRLLADENLRNLPPTTSSAMQNSTPIEASEEFSPIPAQQKSQPRRRRVVVNYSKLQEKKNTTTTTLLPDDMQIDSQPTFSEPYSNQPSQPDISLSSLPTSTTSYASAYPPAATATSISFPNPQYENMFSQFQAVQNPITHIQPNSVAYPLSNAQVPNSSLVSPPPPSTHNNPPFPLYKPAPANHPIKSLSSLSIPPEPTLSADKPRGLKYGEVKILSRPSATKSTPTPSPPTSTTSSNPSSLSSTPSIMPPPPIRPKPKPNIPPPSAASTSPRNNAAPPKSRDGSPPVQPRGSTPPISRTGSPPPSMPPPSIPPSRPIKPLKLILKESTKKSDTSPPIPIVDPTPAEPLPTTTTLPPNQPPPINQSSLLPHNQLPTVPLNQLPPYSLYPPSSLSPPPLPSHIPIVRNIYANFASRSQIPYNRNPNANSNF